MQEKRRILLEDLGGRLFEGEEMLTPLVSLDTGDDVTLSVPLSLRPVLVASLFVRRPQPMLVVVSGEEMVARFSNNLSALLGREQVMTFPCRKDLPFNLTNPDLAAIGARMEALYALSQQRPVVVVASARSLLRCVPPKGNTLAAPLVFAQDQEPYKEGAEGLEYLSYEDLPDELVAMGYQRSDQAQEPGLFSVHGDSMDIFGAGMVNPVRIGFFDTQVETVRNIVASTGQSIGSCSQALIFPCREYGLSNRNIERAVGLLGDKARLDSQIAHHLELISQRQSFREMDRYLPQLFSKTQSPLAHVSPETLMVVVEPRSLVDDAQRYTDEIKAAAELADCSLDGLFVTPNELDFGSNQRLTLLSIMKVGSFADGEIEVERPDTIRTEAHITGNCRKYLNKGYRVVFSLPDRHARESIALLLTDEHIPLNDLSQSEGAEGPKHLQAGVVNITDIDIPTSYVVPQARLAILTLGDSARSTTTGNRNKGALDPTSITFPYKPGDYVVHETHGIALFKEIVRQEVGGIERDYLLLEYAKGDRLFAPIDRIDKVTRYVGPDGKEPRLTRLNTSDWTRATTKARKAAKKLAFDLVDLYTRRSSVKGFAYEPDNQWQEEMEILFPYTETPDQAAAIADVKADMESDKPMDRLVCGDVGFGKTEVAVRAAFKAIQAGRQVMLLCPTTILAQQHFTTFSERFAPFGVKVDVLSRFRTPAQQRNALEAFAEGKIEMLVGTHRLLSRDVNPKDLGLIIIDEEQRFGVQHKEQLKNMREQVDVLTLTATPIPRTLQMSLSGVRDMSIIETPPASRSAVKVHVGEWDEDVVSAAIRFELARNGQVYYVSNRVKNIDDAVARVQAAAPEARVMVAHGQLSERELEKVMESFAADEVDVLVATTIIESGLDNPHTNTLIIEDSQRLGLAQLYQLKGRVGRSHTQAYAYFMFPADASLTQEATDRLTAIDEFQELGSGLKVALRDLEIRGAGSMLGAEQSGNLSAVGFDLFAAMLAQAVTDAREGESAEDAPEIRLDLPVNFFLPEDYIPAVDERVLFYRRIAAIADIEMAERIQQQLEDAYGDLPDAACNMLARARAKVLARQLGISSVALVRGKLTIEGLELNPKQRVYADSKGAIYYVKSHRLAWPVKKDADSLIVLLDLLETLCYSQEKAQD